MNTIVFFVNKIFLKNKKLRNTKKMGSKIWISELISVKMPATNSINIQLTAPPPSKPPSNIGPDRRRHDGRNGSDGRADNGRTYEDDLDYLLEKVSFDNLHLIKLNVVREILFG